MKWINGWRNAITDPPEGSYVNQTVLIVKKDKSGNRKINFGAYMNTGVTGEGGEIYCWSTNNGKGTVLYWMPLPKIPEEEA